jgi:hypothetical protein
VAALLLPLPAGNASAMLDSDAHKNTLLPGIIDSSGAIAALQRMLHNISSNFTLLHPPIRKGNAYFQKYNIRW